MRRNPLKTRRNSAVELGFTLVELLVVIAIIGVLVALLLPAVQAAREAARRTECNNKLHQIGIALHNYHSSHKAFPYGAADGDCENGTGARHPHTWRTMLLPFMEQQAIHDQLDQIALASVTTGCYPRRPWDNSPLQQTPIPEYICPSEPAPLLEGIASWSGPFMAAIASYQGNAGPVATGPLDWGAAESCGICVGSIACPCVFGNTEDRFRGFYHGHNPNGPGMLDMWPNQITIGKVTDGTSNTIHVGETHSFIASTGIGCKDQANWMSSWGIASTVWGINHGAPLGQNWQSHCNYRSFHPGGANFLFADGSVKLLQSSISPALLANLGARNDGNVGDNYTPPARASF